MLTSWARHQWLVYPPKIDNYLIMVFKWYSYPFHYLGSLLRWKKNVRRLDVPMNNASLCPVMQIPNWFCNTYSHLIPSRPWKCWTTFTSLLLPCKNQSTKSESDWNTVKSNFEKKRKATTIYHANTALNFHQIHTCIPKRNPPLDQYKNPPEEQCMGCEEN